jgi:S-adenosylmethionine hydrolase
VTVVTMLTDFVLADIYAGVMKGVILAQAPAPTS